MTEATVAARPQHLFRIGGTLLLLAGAGLVGIAVLADFRTGARGGAFGMGQALAAMLGLAIAVAGLDIRRGLGGDWLASLAQARAAALPLIGLVAQLALLVFVTRWFQIENPAFAQIIVPLAAAGFVIHHLLPARHRLAYFAALSVIGIVTVLGWTNAGWLILVVAVFAALCHLPVPWMGRVAVLAAAGTLLGILRVRPDWTPFSGAIWPILGSILMFRLIVYAYDVRNSKDRVPVKWSLAYFLMLPNVVFPLFPVVDFATFRRTYYDRDALGIYQRGVEWMARGLVHLLVYRAVYQHLTLAPAEVATGAQLVQFMVSTFLLYLRVSGTFHFIVGMLHLFGFRLPETHRFFYLASSFTDLWRRINIYWKDFMMKLVFYPVYFRVRKRGETTALILGTLSVFLITWLTHSYQWFWILGQWLLSWTDGLFWAILGIFLISNSLWELKHGRTRALPGARPSRVREAAGTAVRAVLMFATVCTLWSLWGTPTVGDWLDLMSVQRFGWTDWATVFGVLAVIGVAAFIGALTGKSQGSAERSAAEATTSRSSVFLTAATLAVLALLTTPIVLDRLSHGPQQFVRDLRVPELNKRDAAALTRGYYENLQGVSLQNSQLWEIYAQRPAEGQDIWKSGVLRDRDDFLAKDMKPLFGVFQRGQSFRTNRWGMRDRDYEQAKSPGVERIALLGQSYVAGDGVSDGESFDEVVEDRITNEAGGRTRLQVLNFGVGSFSLPQQLLLLEDRVWSFDPDAILVIGNPVDAERLAIHIVQQMRRGVTSPFPWLNEMIAQAGVTPAMRETEALSRLLPHREAMVERALREIVEAARVRGVRAVWAFLPVPERQQQSPEVVARMTEQARAAGFQVLDWSDVYGGVDLATVQASQWDFHPNAAGHQLIAERFYRALTADTVFGVLR